MTVRILTGDARDVLRSLPADSVDCVVTSPPYWGLRDYGVAGQLGMEATLGEHLEVMVAVFDEVRRVMKPSASLWLNYGDCYATSPNGRSAAATKAAGNDDRTFRDKPFSTVGPIHGARVVGAGVLKPGDLCMIPNRLAIALQDAGWWVKSEIVWGKPNAMPDSSGATRPATAHEKIFLLAKSGSCDLWRARDTGEISTAPDLTEQVPMVTTGKLGRRWIRMPYYYDAASVRVERAQDEDANGFRGGSYTNGEPGPRKTRGNKRIKKPDSWATHEGGHGSFHRDGREAGAYVDKQRGHSRRHQGCNDRWDQMERDEQIANGRFLRNYEPAPLPVWEIAISGFKDAHFATFPPDLAARCILAGCPKGGTVLDPFGGAGTTGLVADRLERDAILIELNPAYAEMARRRIAGDAPLFAEVTDDYDPAADAYGSYLDACKAIRKQIEAGE